MARNGRGQTLTSPEFKIPRGHIANQGDTFDQVQEREEQGLDVSDLAPQRDRVADLGYIAVEEPEIVKRYQED